MKSLLNVLTIKLGSNILIVQRKLGIHLEVMKMEKEEILAKSRKENQSKDLIEVQTIQNGAQIAYVIGMCIALIFVIVEAIVHHEVNYMVLAVVSAFGSPMFIYKYVKLHKKHELLVAICYSVSFVAFLTCYILQLVGII